MVHSKVQQVPVKQPESAQLGKKELCKGRGNPLLADPVSGMSTHSQENPEGPKEKKSKESKNKLLLSSSNISGWSAHALQEC